MKTPSKLALIIFAGAGVFFLPGYTSAASSGGISPPQAIYPKGAPSGGIGPGSLTQKYTHPRLSAKKAALSSAKTRRLISRATNRNSSFVSDLKRSGRCFKKAMVYAGGLSDYNYIRNEIVPMVLMSKIYIHKQGYIKAKRAAAKGTSILSKRIKKTSGPKHLKEGLLGERSLILLGRAAPDFDLCFILKAWENEGYSGAFRIIDSAIGQNKYESGKRDFLLAEKRVVKATRKIASLMGPRWANKFSQSPYKRAEYFFENA